MITIVSWPRFVLFGGVIMLIIAAVIFWLLWGSARIQRTGEFTIEPGQTARKIGERLEQQGYITRLLPWHYYSRLGNAGAKIEAGTYQLTDGERLAAVLDRFTSGDATTDELTVTYPEGFTLEQIAERTAAKKIGSKEEFLKAAVPSNYADTYPYLATLSANRTLEGYLFPDTYKVFVDDKPDDVIRRLLGNFDHKLTPEVREQMSASKRTVDQIIIMASIIEREVIHDQDMALVAGVLWKRFDDGLGLDADATIRYALKKWDGRLTVQDLQTDSPYNTRKYRGLPPGPISNPGRRAIMAAIKPEASPYYYYLSTPDGQTIFAKTNDEHNANKAKHLR